MNFELSEDQQALKDSVERLMREHYAFDARKRYAQERGGWSRAMWARYAELGLLGLPFAATDGGHGMGPVETMLVMESLGRALAPEPYLATVVLGGGCLRLVGDAAQRTRNVPQIVAGELLLAFAHAERQARYCLSDVQTTAARDGSAWTLSGEKSLVLHGDAADLFVVSARVSGAQRDEQGLALFLVDSRAPGVSLRGYMTQDGLRAAEVSLAKVRVDAANVLGEPGAAYGVIEELGHQCIAALCAEATGIMETLLDKTVAYLKTREQFGQPIGKFQALQHRAADMFVQTELARSMSSYATMMLGERDALERGKALSAAKAQIGISARFVGQQSIQLHGGIGMTEEYSVGHYFRRLVCIEALFGDTDFHLDRLAEQGSLLGGA